MKLLSIMVLVLAVGFSPVMAKDDVTKVPETKLSLWLPDELTPEEEDEATNEDMFESFKFDSQKTFAVMAESELTLTVIVFKLPKDHGMSMGNTLTQASDELVKAFIEDEEMNLEINSKTKATIGVAEIRKMDMTMPIENLKVKFNTVMIGSKEEIILIMGFFMDDQKEAVEDWNHMIESLVYDEKKASKYLPWDAKPEPVKPDSNFRLF